MQLQTILKDFIICFQCKKYFANPEPDSYPNHCCLCRIKYNEKGMYCMPDLLLIDAENDNKKSVVFVNGKVHEKTKVKKKDKFQIEKLREMKIRHFIVNNEEIANLRNTNLRLLVSGIFQANKDLTMYESAFKNEKEIIQ